MNSKRVNAIMDQQPSSCSKNPPISVRGTRNHTERLKGIMAQRTSKSPKCPLNSVRGRNFIERMPSEIIEKIISYLDAGSLFCLGFVNKCFHELAENNAIWYHFYTWHRAKSKTSRQIMEVTDGVSMASIREKPNGYWRRVFFQEMISHYESYEKKLKIIHPYTGLPLRTASVIRSVGLTWEITVKEATRRENRVKNTRVYFGQTSLTIVWSSGNWPSLDQPTTLELHGVRLVPINTPLEWRPGYRSLLSTVVMKKDAGKWISSDRLISLLYMQKGVIVGVWQKEKGIAFILVTLHYHRLVERNLLGSSTIPYEPTERKALFDDIDPNYGLLGYSVHLELHNTIESIASLSFIDLFCREDQIADGFIPLKVITKENKSRQTPLLGKVSMPWKTDGLQGHIEHCCMLSLTVLAEAQMPFWCVSAPATVTKSTRQEVLYAYNAESFIMEYQDSDGRLKIELEWMEDQKQFVMVDLIVFLSLSKVNRHFRRNYQGRF